MEGLTDDMHNSEYDSDTDRDQDIVIDDELEEQNDPRDIKDTVSSKGFSIDEILRPLRPVAQRAIPRQHTALAPPGADLIGSRSPDPPSSPQHALSRQNGLHISQDELMTSCSASGDVNDVQNAASPASSRRHDVTPQRSPSRRSPPANSPGPFPATSSSASPRHIPGSPPGPPPPLYPTLPNHPGAGVHHPLPHGMCIGPFSPVTPLPPFDPIAAATNPWTYTQNLINRHIFGLNAPKPVGRRARKAGVDRKPRQAYSAKQLERLEAEFKKDKYLSVSKRMEMSQTLGLTETQIKTWFQNRRTKWKKQMTARIKMAQRQGLWPAPYWPPGAAPYPSTPQSFPSSYLNSPGHAPYPPAFPLQ